MPLVRAATEANFENIRCRCVCPSTMYFSDAENSTDDAESNHRRYYTKTNLEPGLCNPQTVVRSEVTRYVDNTHMDAFLANCDCRSESRNTVLLKVVVIFVICVIAVLTGYMTFLMCLDPMLRKKRFAAPYRQQTEEMENNIFAAPSQVPSEVNIIDSSVMDPEGTTRARNTANVLGRVEAEQNRWMRKVEEQRRNIFEDHTMLN
ncbi:unnamed protein product [Caenorhabditis auriculariae]|uniref:Transmembrane protein 9 n=1 Tax=Caenorhabditis auriculariae TaxID=2777116 RepID=A0A8S1HDA7_9PELO|nr:unnamed protein product [Caenorhabditis auriculariae]